MIYRARHRARIARAMTLCLLLLGGSGALLPGTSGGNWTAPALAQAAGFGPITFAQFADKQFCPIDPSPDNAFPSGITTLRGFFSYQGMSDETAWEARWLLDEEEVKREGGRWQGSSDSPCAFVPLQADELPAPLGGDVLPDGSYTLILSIDGAEVQRATATVGLGQPAGSGTTGASNEASDGNAPAAIADIALYRSEQFGFIVWWKPEWAVADTIVEPGHELLWLQAGSTGSAVFYEAWDKPDMSLAGCLEADAEAWRTNPTVDHLTLEWTNYQASFDLSATARTRIQFTADAQANVLLDETTCQVIGQDEIVFGSSAIYPDVAEVTGEVADVKSQAGHVVFPPKQWPHPEPEGFERERFSRVPIILGQLKFGDPSWVSGDEPGAFVSVAFLERSDAWPAGQEAPPLDHHYATVTASFTNHQESEPLTVGPGRFYLEDRAGYLYFPAYWSWERGVEDTSEEVHLLQPGDSARLVAWFLLPDAAAVRRVTCRCALVPSGPRGIGDSNFDVGNVTDHLQFTFGESHIAMPEGAAGIWQLDGGANDVQQWIWLLIENDGTEPLTIDPEQFAVMPVGEETLVPPTSHRWVGFLTSENRIASGNVQGPYTLQPGELAVLELDTSPSPEAILVDDFYVLYEPNRATRVGGT
jgi:hypothetical protein